MKKLFLAVAVAMLAACGGSGSGTSQSADQSAQTKSENQAATDNAHNAQNSLDVKGTYQGVEGVDEVAVSLEDSTYTRVAVTPGKDSKTSVSEGKYEWDKTGKIITLMGSDGTHSYFVGENTLSKLDETGNKVKNPDDNYQVLRKEP